jgi:arylsulfatase A-like enzyme
VARPFKSVVNVDIREAVPDWEPYTQAIAPEEASNVVYIVLDDVGFSAMEPFGGLIETPNINRIAGRRLTYTNFHTAALCSPTRSCPLKGRDQTTNGMAVITEAASGT